MIRLVTLDLYDTLACAVPTRPERFATVCAELGLVADLDLLRRGYVRADDFYTRGNGRSPLHNRDPRRVREFYRHFTRYILAVAGLPTDARTCLEVRRRLDGLGPTQRVQYPDVRPALTALRARGIKLAVVSNTPVDCTPLCDRLGLTELVDFIVSSCLVGCEKPCRRIFEFALEQAGVAPAEALHVGDQPLSDVIGALRVGMGALLIDRDDLRPNVWRCPRLRSLVEVERYLDKPGHATALPRPRLVGARPVIGPVDLRPEPAALVPLI